MAKYYYNGVLLPEIPADVLASYPYCWIRKHNANNAYQLILSESGFYHSGTAIYANNGIITPQYTFPIGDTTETTWVNANNQTYYGWTVDEARPCMWSNHDITNDSADATEIYFVASPIMPEDRPAARLEYIKSIGYSYLNTGVIPDANTEAEVTYAVDACSIYGCHVLSNAQWYFPFSRTYGDDPHFLAYNMGGAQVKIQADDVLSTVHTIRAYPNGNIIIDGEIAGNAAAGTKTSANPLYLLAYGGAPASINYTGTSRLYQCKIWQSGELVRDYVPYCQMGVPGLKEMVSGQFYPSEGTLAFSAGPVALEYVPHGWAELSINDVRSISHVTHSSISWDSYVPDGTTLTVYSKLSNGVYALCENGGNIRGISQGDDLSNETLWIKVEMTTESPNTTPKLTNVHVIIGDMLDDRVIVLYFDSGNTKSIQRAVGDITVAYDGSGTLKGLGGPVLAFEETFTPNGLNPKNNPNDEEHIEISSIEAICDLKRIMYTSVQSGNEHIEITGVEAFGTLTSINDI